MIFGILITLFILQVHALSENIIVNKIIEVMLTYRNWCYGKVRICIRTDYQRNEFRSYDNIYDYSSILIFMLIK